jgi:hypothetical protein
VPAVFTNNHDRLLKHSVARSFFRRVSKLAENFQGDKHSNQTHESKTDPDANCAARAGAAKPD